MAEKNITAGEPRRISGIEAIFCFFAIEQLKKPVRTVRKAFSCWLCKKTVEPGDDALGNWHEMCVLGLACQIEPGFKAILASCKYRIVSEEPGKTVIEPIERKRRGRAA